VDQFQQRGLGLAPEMTAVSFTWRLMISATLAINPLAPVVQVLPLAGI
jgi:hypothetical protein